MRRFTIAFAALIVAVGLALAISACGSDSTTTVISTASESTTTPTTTKAPTTPTTPTSTSAGPSSCGPNQAFSQVSHTCVNTNPGGNPCPNGQVPMADKPICVKE